MLVQRAFRTKFKIPYCPTRRTILCLSKKFEKTGTLHDLPPKPKNQRELHLEAKNQLKILFTEDPSLSIRKASVATSISYSLCRDILLKELLLKPYKYQSAHQLLPLDYEKRVHFAQWWVGLHNDSHKWLIATDEAYFYLTESINKQQSLKYTSQ